MRDFVIAGENFGADTTKPIEQVRTEAQQMDAQTLQKTVDTYTAALASKEGELQKLAEKWVKAATVVLESSMGVCRDG